MRLRFTREQPRKHEFDDERVVEKFLIFPKWLYSKHSMDVNFIRWLERATIRQIYLGDNQGWSDKCWDDA